MGQHSRGLKDIVRFHMKWYCAVWYSFANGTFHNTEMPVSLSVPTFHALRPDWSARQMCKYESSFPELGFSMEAYLLYFLTTALTVSFVSMQCSELFGERNKPREREPPQRLEQSQRSRYCTCIHRNKHTGKNSCTFAANF